MRSLKFNSFHSHSSVNPPPSWVGLGTFDLDAELVPKCHKPVMEVRPINSDIWRGSAWVNVFWVVSFRGKDRSEVLPSGMPARVCVAVGRSTRLCARSCQCVNALMCLECVSQCLVYQHNDSLFSRPRAPPSPTQAIHLVLFFILRLLVPWSEFCCFLLPFIQFCFHKVHRANTSYVLLSCRMTMACD